MQNPEQEKFMAKESKHFLSSNIQLFYPLFVHNCSLLGLLIFLFLPLLGIDCAIKFPNKFEHESSCEINFGKFHIIIL